MLVITTQAGFFTLAQHAPNEDGITRMAWRRNGGTQPANISLYSCRFIPYLCSNMVEAAYILLTHETGEIIEDPRFEQVLILLAELVEKNEQECRVGG